MEKPKKGYLLQVRLNDYESDLVKEYSKIKNISLSDFTRYAILEKIQREKIEKIVENERKEG